MRGLLGEHLNGLAIEREAFSLQVRERRPCSRGHARSIAALALQHIVLREQRHFSLQLVGAGRLQQNFVRTDVIRIARWC